MRYLPLIFVLFTNATANAQERMSDGAIANIGSSMAYVAQCEKGRLIPIGTTRDLLVPMQKKVGSENWIRIKHQYQVSLYAKKQYSIVADKWFDFQITPDSCNDLNSALPLLKSFFE